jgi:ABC-type multidrug transport system fused ATPase/permease subunit
VLLFRLVDPAGGDINIDGQNVLSIGLLALRRNMGIIPQEPLLLEGSVSSNVDPFNEFTEERVMEVLKRVGLGSQLNTKPGNLSAGEKQLLQMARALIRDVRVIVMDEPTSNIDPNTDMLMQQIVREDFSKQTVITIAHRLDTIIDADKVMVMQGGNVAEFASPKELLTSTSIFATMVDGEGKARAMDLRQKAGIAGSRDGILELADVNLEKVALDCDNGIDMKTSI